MRHVFLKAIYYFSLETEKWMESDQADYLGSGFFCPECNLKVCDTEEDAKKLLKGGR
jgi:hypothetical protein